MQKPLHTFLAIGIAMLIVFQAQAQVGKVGINTTEPVAMLQVKDSSVLFTGPLSLPMPAGSPPGSGTGHRTAWFANKAAFRTGYVSAVNWHQDSMGIYSLAAGNNSKAKGPGSIALGNSNVSRGENSFTAGSHTNATGSTSVAMGNASDAPGI